MPPPEDRVRSRVRDQSGERWRQHMDNYIEKGNLESYRIPKIKSTVVVETQVGNITERVV